MQGSLIDQVKFHLDGETPSVKTYGAGGGHQAADFDLNPGEWLVAVLRRELPGYYQSLLAVQFETNTGRKSQWYGSRTWRAAQGIAVMPRLAAPPGQMIVGLVMRTGGFCCNGIQDIVSIETKCFCISGHNTLDHNFQPVLLFISEVRSTKSSPTRR